MIFLHYMKIFLKHNPLFSLPFKHLQYLTQFQLQDLQAVLKTATYNELILQLEKGCVTLKETDTAGMKTTELCTESTGVLHTYLGLNFTRVL